MDYFNIMRNFWDYCFENPDKIRPIHIAVYCFAVEHCNRLGWKERFGFPTMMVCEAIGIKSVTTYSKALDELEKMKLIKVVEKSKNQWSANVIALSIFDKANNKALDKARGKHVSKHMESTPIGTVSIIRPNTSKQKDKRQEFFSFFLSELAKKPEDIFYTGTDFNKRKIAMWKMFEPLGYTIEQCKAYYERLHDRSWTNKDGDPYTVKMLVDEVLYYHKRGWLNTGADDESDSE
jgi:hypothetical protein